MDVYVVVDWEARTVVGVSAREQGGEVIRIDHACLLATKACPPIGEGHDRGKWTRTRDEIYDRQQIVNTELQDAE